MQRIKIQVPRQLGASHLKVRVNLRRRPAIPRQPPCASRTDQSSSSFTQFEPSSRGANVFRVFGVPRRLTDHEHRALTRLVCCVVCTRDVAKRSPSPPRRHEPETVKMMDTQVLNGAPRRQPELGLVVSTLSNPGLRCILLTQFQSNEDSVYEQDIIREPASIKPWLAYIQFKSRHGTILEQAFVMERACTQLPRSYKLWKQVRLTGLLCQSHSLTRAVSRVPHQARIEAEPCVIRRRISKSERPF